MTQVSPNNIASEEWEIDFDLAFVIKPSNKTKSGWATIECDPEFVKAFISKTRQEAIAGERKKILREALQELPRTFWEDEDHAVGGYISKKDLYNLLTPSPDTSKLSQCNDCFDGDHEKCSKGQCGCTH